MNSEGVSHRAMPEQENKGMVPSLILLHPGREGEKGGRGCLKMVRGKQPLKPIGKKNGCSLVWRMQSTGNAEEG